MVQESPLKTDSNDKLRWCCCSVIKQQRQLFITFGTLDELVAINTKVPRQAGRQQDMELLEMITCVAREHTHTHARRECVYLWDKQAPRGQKSKQLQLNSIAVPKGPKGSPPARAGVIHLAWPGYTYLHEVHEVMMRMEGGYCGLTGNPTE